jgi:hypothetical protein
MTKRPLTEWKSEELEQRLESAASFASAADVAEAKRILRERYARPDRNLQRWILTVAIVGVAVGIVGVVLTFLTWYKV